MPERGNVPKILIVDDEPEICDYMKEYFKERGFKPFTATTKEGAINSVHKHEPDVVLLDIKLTATPKKYDGLEVLSEIRKDHSKTKVIMVTAVDDKEIIEKAVSLGACDYITKPISLEYLENTVVNKIQEALSPSPKPGSPPSSPKP